MARGAGPWPLLFSHLFANPPNKETTRRPARTHLLLEPPLWYLVSSETRSSTRTWSYREEVTEELAAPDAKGDGAVPSCSSWGRRGASSVSRDIRARRSGSSMGCVGTPADEDATGAMAGVVRLRDGAETFVWDCQRRGCVLCLSLFVQIGTADCGSCLKK